MSAAVVRIGVAEGVARAMQALYELECLLPDERARLAFLSLLLLWLEAERTKLARS